MGVCRCRAGIIREYRGSGEWNGPEKRGYRATGPEGRGCGVHIPAVCLRCIFGVPAEVRDGDLYGASEGRRKLPVGCLQGRKARLHSRKKIVNLLLIRKPTEKWPTRSPAGHSPCLHRYYFSAGLFASCAKQSPLSFDQMRERYYLTLVPDADLSDTLVQRRINALDDAAGLFGRA